MIRHFSKSIQKPAKLQERVFTKLFELAQIGKFNQEEMQKYEESLKVYWDMHAVIETAKDEAFDEGKIEGKIEVARKAILQGLNNEIIAELTNLSVEDIEKLRKN